ncbi:MAG: hypothetical protein WKF55_00670 [Gemmatimonadaceae bacterium]
MLACVFAAISIAALSQDTVAPQPAVDSAGLVTLLSEAARVNAQIPERLRAYRAGIETEMSLALLDSGGRERTVQIEQIASDVRWRAPGRYDQRVTGYRSQAVGPAFSLMSIFGGWTTPTLYGNRLQLGVIPATASSNLPRTNSAGLAIHPLATSRDTYYAFSGGDTAVVLFSQGRRIPVVNVRVEPRINAPGDAILFYGDMQLDADRKQIVRMRGRMVEVRNGRQTIASGSRIPGVSGASFVELVNVEVDGQYWLPAYQRTELQARIGLFGDFRSIIRIVSRFNTYRTNDSSWTARSSAPPGVRHHLTFAPSDSLSRFDDWAKPLGASSEDVYYADFDDLAPAAWSTNGRSTVQFRPQSLGEVFRFNRVEGLFTGIAAKRDFRDSAPGLSVRGSIGYAWAEGVPRGMFGIEQRRGRTTAGMRVERSLNNTNDFVLPLSWGATIPALLGSRDDFDYLDRRSATAFVSRALGLERRSVVRFEIGPGSDNSVQQNASQGLYVGDGGFLPNRGIVPGSFVRSATTLELNPQVSGLFVDRGIGARVHYERGDGDLRWQRLELRIAARRELGPFELFARGDAGTLLGTPIPQSMFEIGSSEGLGAYGYKEFAGDRAAIGRATVGYNLPVLRAPVRLPANLIVPGIAPGVAAGIRAGWTDISGPAAQTALLRLGSRLDTASGVVVPISRPTDGIRATAELLLTFFSGSVSVGVTRPIDQSGPWKFTGRIGQGF